MPTRNEWEALRTGMRDALFDALVANPDGLDIEQIRTELECGPNLAKRAVRDLRLMLGDFDDINVPCIPQGAGERWLYVLQAGVGDDVREWSDHRLDDGETRLRTIRAMLSSAVAATDGRTSSGKRARIMERGVRRMIEDLDELLGR